MRASEVPTNREIRVRKRPIVVRARRTIQEEDIETLEGIMVAQAGDIVITGTEGERYPVKAHIFEQIYEKVEPCNHA
jgi:hypothetical protein